MFLKNLILLSLPLLFFSCEKKEKENSTFNLNYTTDVSIPASASVGIPINKYSDDIETNSASEFENENTRDDLIEYIRAEEVILTITNSTSQGFGIAESIELFINADGETEQSVGKLLSIPEDASFSIELDIPSQVDYQEYIKKENFAYRLKIKNRERFPQDINIRIRSGFEVKGAIDRD